MFGRSSDNQNYNIAAYLFTPWNMLKLNFDGTVGDAADTDLDSS